MASDPCGYCGRVGEHNRVCITREVDALRAACRQAREALKKLHGWNAVCGESLGRPLSAECCWIGREVFTLDAVLEEPTT